MVVRGTLAPGLTTANGLRERNGTTTKLQRYGAGQPSPPVPADAWWTLLLLAAALAAGISAENDAAA